MGTGFGIFEFFGGFFWIFFGIFWNFFQESVRIFFQVIFSKIANKFCVFFLKPKSAQNFMQNVCEN